MTFTTTPGIDGCMRLVLVSYPQGRELTVSRSNESENLAMRYRKFDIRALIDTAVHAVGNGARSCIKLLKCTEGQYNKAFLLTMDNKVEVLAKIPNPNAGPDFYTTASEVATRDFLRTVLNLPLPRIYTYASDSCNPVGAEYIIEAKADGQPLGRLWQQWKPESQLSLVAQLVDFEAKLTSVSFNRHGCIYYKDDLKKKGLRAHSLEACYLSPDSSMKGHKVNSDLTEQFAIGPLTDAKLWDGERSTMDLDRGPWSTPLAYMAAMGLNEIQWLRAFAKPRVNTYRPLEAPESPDDYVSLLKRYLQLLPHLSPGPFRTSLSHRDLHLDNIFVDPDTKKIACVIDWQSASVSEPFLQPRIPRMLLSIGQGSPLPKDISSAPEHPEGSTEYLLSHYQKLSMLKNEQRWAAINLHNRQLLTDPVSLFCGAWSRNDVFSVRHALINVAARWEEISTTPCPITFSAYELELHNDELELVEGLGEVLQQLQNENLIPLGGMIPREKYEHALQINENVKQMFVDMAQSESQKVLYSRIWPYQN